MQNIIRKWSDYTSINKIDFKAKNVTRDKESLLQGNVTFIMSTDPEYMNQNK